MKHCPCVGDKGGNSRQLEYVIQNCTQCPVFTGPGLGKLGSRPPPPPATREKIPPLRTRGIFGPPIWGGHRRLVVGVFDCRPIRRRFQSALCWSTLTFSPVVHGWANKGLGMSSRVYATGHIKDHVPLIGKSRASCPGGRFPPIFIHQVIIITRLNKLHECMFSPRKWPYVPTRRKTSTQTKKNSP